MLIKSNVGKLLTWKVLANERAFFAVGEPRSFKLPPQISFFNSFLKNVILALLLFSCEFC